MDPFEEHLLDRDLHEALGNDGPAPELKGRILDAMAGRPAARTRRPSGRVIPLPVRRTPWGAYAAAAAALALAVAAFGWAMSRPSEPSNPTPVSQGNAPVREEKTQQPAPVKPEPQPEPQPQPESQPQPQPEPQPENGSDPIPEKGPDPRPAPEPTPQPQPEKPDDVVEKPEPKPEPEKPDTEAKPEQRAVVASVAADSKLKYRALASAEWLPLDSAEVLDGWQLKADAATDIALTSGARLRLDGELAISAGRLDLLGRRTQLYIDALGTEGALQLHRDELHLELSGSEVLFDADGSAVEIFCFQGSVQAGEVVPAGKRAKLSARGLGGLRDLKDSEREPRLLKGMTPRVLYRSELDGAEGVTADSVTGGVAKVSGENASLTIKLPRELAALPGAELRLRFKPLKAGALYVQLQKQAGEMQWGKWTRLDQLGEWLEWSIPLTDLQRDDGRSEAAMQAGDAFININLFIQDGAEAELELDWLEIVRVR
jgi:hypothetical protein